MADRTFKAKNGLQVNNALLDANGTSNTVSLVSNTFHVNTSGIHVGADVHVNTSVLSIGNSTVNVQVNSSVLLIGDEPVVATSPAGANGYLQYHWNGSFSANNLLNFDPTNTKLTVGSTTANTTANATALAVANSTQNTIITPISASFGNSTVTVTVNSSIVQIGANAIHDQVKSFYGNSTINAVINSIALEILGLTTSTLKANTTLINLGNSSVFANLTSNALTLGNTSVRTVANDSQVSVGSSVKMNVTHVDVTTGANYGRLSAGEMKAGNATNFATANISGMSTSGGIAAGSSTMPAAGAITATGDITAFASDKRLKKDLKKITNALKKVKSLNGYYYKFNDLAGQLNPAFKEKKRRVGVIAQEIKEVLPEVVVRAPFDYQNGKNGHKKSKSGKDYLTVQYEKIIPLLIEAIKELSDKVDRLEGK